MPTLILRYPEKRKRWRVHVTKDSFTIGRSPSADVSIPLRSVSKEHAKVERRGARFVFLDLESRNGVYLNGFRAKQGALVDGDELQVGQVWIKFYKKEPPKTDSKAKKEPDDAMKPREGLASLEAELDKLQPLEDSGPDSDSDSKPDLDLGSDPKLNDLALSPDEQEGETLLLKGEGLELLEEDIRVPLADLDKPLEKPKQAPMQQPTEGALPSGKKPPRYVPLRHAEHRRRRVLSAPALVFLAVCSVGGGLSLGFLSSWVDPQSKKSSSQENPGNEELGLSPVAPDDEWAVHRLLFRLSYDMLGRPPLRDEARELPELPLDELWAEVDSRRAEKSATPEGIMTTAFPRYLGREATSQEFAEVLDRSGKDPKYFVFHLTTTQAYTSAEHRRKKSEKQLAQSLYVDFLDRVATVEEAKSVIEALASPQGGLEKVARMFADRASTGPKPEVSAESWCREAYGRFLLRPPSAEEEIEAVASIGKDKKGWRDVLFALAKRPEYLEY